MNVNKSLIVVLLLSLFGVSIWGTKTYFDNSQTFFSYTQTTESNLPEINQGQPYPMGKRQLLFEENKGQIKDQFGNPTPDVLFSGENNGLTYFLKRSGLSFQLQKPLNPKNPTTEPEDPHEFVLPEPDSLIIHRVDIEWLSDNQSYVQTGKAVPGEISHYYNVAEGNNPALNVRKYSSITYKSVWKGIDFYCFGKNGKFESDWLVHKPKDYKKIRFRVSGASVSVDEAGYLILETDIGILKEGALQVYQNASQIPATWVVDGDVVSFDIPNYDKNIPLRIDPPLQVWGTYYGGSASEQGAAVALDLGGNAHVVGRTSSVNQISTVGAHQDTLAGIYDVFLAKFDEDGVRLWATYLGGSQMDFGFGCDVDSMSYVYITGHAFSNSGIATFGSFQPINNGDGDAFLVKFTPTGIREWGTFIGGAELEMGHSVATDINGDVFVAGQTLSSTNISTPLTFMPTYAGGSDAFLMKFDANGNRLWGTYFGGPSTETGYSCTSDNFGQVYLSGEASSFTGIASPGAHQTAFGGGIRDAFLAKFTATGQRIWSTYLGGANNEVGWTCTTVDSGVIYLGGSTSSSQGISTPGTYQTSNAGSSDGFLAKFSSNGTRLWGTYYGGPQNDIGYACAMDYTGEIFLGGRTWSTTGISTPNGNQPTFGGGINDGFLAKFDDTGNLVWGTYYGGGQEDIVNDAAADYRGGGVIVGNSNSSNQIATPNGHQTVFGGGTMDALVARFGLDCYPPDVICVSRLPYSNEVDITFIPSTDTGAFFYFHILEVDTSLTGDFYIIDTIPEFDPETYRATIPHNQSLYLQIRSVSGDSCVSNPSVIIGTLDLNLVPRPINSPHKDTADLSWNNPRPGNPANILYVIEGEFPTGSGNWIALDSTTALSIRQKIYHCDMDVTFRVTYRSYSQDSTQYCTNYSNLVNAVFSNKINNDTIDINFVTINTLGQAVIDFEPSQKGDIVAYLVMHFNTNTGNWEVIDTVGAMAAYTWQQSLADERVERFKVVSLDSCGNASSELLATAHNTILLENTLNICNKTNLLRWNSYRDWGSKLQGYELRVDIDDLQGNVVNDVLLYSGTDTTFLHDENLGEARYCYRVKAIHADSVWESESQSVCIDPNRMTPSKFLTISRTRIRGDGVEMLVYVDTNSGADQVLIERATSRHGTYFEVAVVAKPKTRPFSFAYIDYLAQPNDGVYFYRAITQDSCGNVDTISNIVNNILINVESKPNEQNWVSWSAYRDFAGELDRYELFRANGSTGSFRLIADDLSPNDTFFIDQTEKLNSYDNTFCYRVQAVERNNPHDLPSLYQPFRSRSNVACVTKQAKLMLPNAFRPGSPIAGNQYFGIGNRHLDFDRFSMVIIDRWGKVVFETKDPNVFWDGNINGKSAPMGVYSYVVHYRSVGGMPLEEKGTVTLIR